MLQLSRFFTCWPNKNFYKGNIYLNLSIILIGLKKHEALFFRRSPTKPLRLLLCTRALALVTAAAGILCSRCLTCSSSPPQAPWRWPRSARCTAARALHVLAACRHVWHVVHDGPSRVLWLRLVRLSAASSGRGAAVHVSELLYLKLSDPARIQSRPHRRGACGPHAPRRRQYSRRARARGRRRAPQRRGAWPGAASRSPRAAAPALTRATSALTSHHGRAPLLYVQIHACTMYMESLVHGTLCTAHSRESI